jgi:hypothetical protein
MTPAAAGIAKWASSIGAELNSKVATRSPFASPAAWSAFARRHERSASSAYVNRRSPSITAWRSGYMYAALTRKSTGLSSERYTLASEGESVIVNPPVI